MPTKSHAQSKKPNLSLHCESPVPSTESFGTLVTADLEPLNPQIESVKPCRRLELYNTWTQKICLWTIAAEQQQVLVALGIPVVSLGMILVGAKAVQYAR